MTWATASRGSCPRCATRGARLADAFGLDEHLRWTGEDGVVGTPRCAWASRSSNSRSRRRTHPTPEALGGASGALVVLVDDVDAHFEHARSRGARSCPRRTTDRGDCANTPPKTQNATAGKIPRSSCATFRRSSGARRSPRRGRSASQSSSKRRRRATKSRPLADRSAGESGDARATALVACGGPCVVKWVWRRARSLRRR